MSDADRQAFEDATRGLNFTKEFWTHQEAIMSDPMETHGARFMAWLRRRSWGNFRLYAVRGDGQPATQADCERELGIQKSTISKTVAYYEKRGYLRRKAKLLYPVIAPQLGPNLEPIVKKLRKSATYLQFLETWKVAHSSNFQEREAARDAAKVARSIYKRIDKVILSDYKKFLASATNPTPSLMRDRESLREEESSVGRSASPPSKSATTTAVEEHVVVAEKLSDYGTPTERGARQLLTDCRKKTPGCIVEVILEAIDRVGHTMRGKDGKIRSSIENPIGLLLKTVPDTVAAIALEYGREREQGRQNRKAADQATAKRILANPTEHHVDDVQWARQVLGIPEEKGASANA